MVICTNIMEHGKPKYDDNNCTAQSVCLHI